jgi:hypothetical protein
VGLQLSSPPRELPDHELTVAEAVSLARLAAGPAIRTLRNIALGGGGRGAREQNTACKLLLETARFIGSQAEAPSVTAVQEARATLRLVDSDRAVELLRQRRLAEHGGQK